MINSVGRQILMTRGIADAIENKKFGDFVHKCFNRFIMNDWGEMDAEDLKANDDALVSKDRILASYEIPDGIDVGESKVWIITEWGRSATTLLFPSEY